MLPLLVTGLLSFSGTGRILYITKTSADEIVLGSLDLQTRKAATLGSIGPSTEISSFWTEAAALVGSTFYATVQKVHPGPSMVPKKCGSACPANSTCCGEPGSSSPFGTCFKVDNCSKLPTGPPHFTGLTIGLDSSTGAARAKHNTSQCWALAGEPPSAPPPHGAAAGADALLCVEESGGNETYGGQSTLRRIEMATGRSTHIGSYPDDMVVMNDAAAVYRGVSYAFLCAFGAGGRATGRVDHGVDGGLRRRRRRTGGRPPSDTHLYGLDISTGALVSSAAPPTLGLNLVNLGCDESLGCFGAVNTPDSKYPMGALARIEPKTFDATQLHPEGNPYAACAGGHFAVETLRRSGLRRRTAGTFPTGTTRSTMACWPPTPAPSSSPPSSRRTRACGSWAPT